MRILVVDDEVRLAAALQRGLEADGFAVDIAHTGDEGLFLASEMTYDAIVLDIMLPGISGYEVCRRLRELDIWTPILMLTAKTGEYDEAEALDTGADDYLSKPFSFVVLLAHLRALIRRGAPSRPTLLTAGDLEIDPGARRCRRGDVDCVLTTREFAILEYLMRHAGQVVTKSEIVEHVWDMHYDGPLNIVEVHVSSLRRKIDTPFGRQSIETMRGAGYRLDANGG